MEDLPIVDLPGFEMRDYGVDESGFHMSSLAPTARVSTGNEEGGGDLKSGSSVHEHVYKVVIDGFLLTAVSLFGIVGTSMAIRVLLRPNLRNSFSTLLAVLAVCDVTFLAVAVLLLGLPHLWEWYKTVAFVYVAPMAFGMLGVARTGSVYLTMSVTLERYFAIVRPLAVFRIKKFLAPAAITFALVYNSPRFFEFKRQPMPEVFQPHSSGFQFDVLDPSLYIQPGDGEQNVVDMNRLLEIINQLNGSTGKMIITNTQGNPTPLPSVPKILLPTVKPEPTQVTRYQLAATELRDNPIYINVYTVWMSIILLEAVPYVTILVLNALIIRQILRSYNFRQGFLQSGGIECGHTGLHRGASVPQEADIAELEEDVESIVGGAVSNKAGTQAVLYHGQGKVSTSILSVTTGTPFVEPVQIETTVVPFSVPLDKQDDGVETIVRSHTASRGSLDHEDGGPKESNGIAVNTQDEIQSSEAVVANGNKGGWKDGRWALTMEEQRPRPAKQRSTTSVTTNLTKASSLNRTSSSFCGPTGGNNQQVNHEMSLGLTLVAISFLFICCQALKIFTKVYELICTFQNVEVCTVGRGDDLITSLANLMCCFNSAANFLVYMLRGKKFRDAFLHTYGCRKVTPSRGLQRNHTLQGGAQMTTMSLLTPMPANQSKNQVETVDRQVITTKDEDVTNWVKNATKVTSS